MGDFKSEPYRNFLKSHTSLNNYIKVSTVAVDFLYNSTDNSEELSRLINELILKSGQRWTPRIISDPKEELSVLKNDLIKTGIIWVYSAFDFFFKQVEGMLSDRFSKSELYFNGNDADFDDDEDSGEDKMHKITTFYNKLSWSTEEIDDILIILKYFEALRHSVAHNVGRPSRKLIKISLDYRFKEAMVKWKTKVANKSISPPPIVSNKSIELKPHDSILYSETCLRIARDINNKLLLKLGVAHFVDKTLKKHLLDTSKLSTPVCQNLTRYIIYHLNEDYGIYVTPYNDVFNGLALEYILDCKKRYSSLKLLV